MTRWQGLRLGLLVAALAMLALPAAAPAAPTVQDNQVTTSFDGTKIVYTLFTPDGASQQHPAPAVLITHGWGGSRQTSVSGFVQQLLDNGYAVLTWDSRGFGESGGVVEVDDPDVEARDLSALIDVLAKDPRIARNGRNDPKVGMSGGSYAGGIQWVSAARDKRIDAIAPEISWHNLLQSLFPEGVVKTGWGVALYAAGQTAKTGGLEPDNPAGPQTGGYDPIIDEAFEQGTTTGDWTPDVQDFFARKGPDYLLARITAPTFIIQATTDDLFPPDQAVRNYEQFASEHPRVPLKMNWYCGGHGACAPYSSGPANYTQDEIVNWFDRFVKGDRSVGTGPRFEYLTNDGSWHGATDYPVPGTTPRKGSGSGTVAVNGSPTASGLVTGTDAPGSLQIPIDSAPGTLIGAPRVTLTENGTGTATDEPNKATVFFQLVDTTTGNVVGNQITPKVFDTDGADHAYTFEVEPVAYTIPSGDKLALEIASTSTSYEPYRGAAVVNFKQVEVEVPSLP